MKRRRGTVVAETPRASKRKSEAVPKGAKAQAMQQEPLEQPKKRAARAPKSDKLHVPKSDRVHLPKSNKVHVPTSDEGSAPTSDNVYVSTSDEGSTPTSDKGSTPTSDEESTPTSDEIYTQPSAKKEQPASKAAGNAVLEDREKLLASESVLRALRRISSQSSKSTKESQEKTPKSAMDLLQMHLGKKKEGTARKPMATVPVVESQTARSIKAAAKPLEHASIFDPEAVEAQRLQNFVKPMKKRTRQAQQLVVESSNTPATPGKAPKAQKQDSPVVQLPKDSEGTANAESARAAAQAGERAHAAAAAKAKRPSEPLPPVQEPVVPPSTTRPKRTRKAPKAFEPRAKSSVAATPIRKHGTIAAEPAAAAEASAFDGQKVESWTSQYVKSKAANPASSASTAEATSAMPVSFDSKKPKPLPDSYAESPLTKAKRIDAQNTWREQQLQSFVLNKERSRRMKELLGGVEERTAPVLATVDDSLAAIFREKENGFLGAEAGSTFDIAEERMPSNLGSSLSPFKYIDRTTEISSLRKLAEVVVEASSLQELALPDQYNGQSSNYSPHRSHAGFADSSARPNPSRLPLKVDAGRSNASLLPVPSGQQEAREEEQLKLQRLKERQERANDKKKFLLQRAHEAKSKVSSA